jgi:hypothetical protein
MPRKVPSCCSTAGRRLVFRDKGRDSQGTRVSRPAALLVKRHSALQRPFCAESRRRFRTALLPAAVVTQVSRIPRALMDRVDPVDLFRALGGLDIQVALRAHDGADDVEGQVFALLVHAALLIFSAPQLRCLKRSTSRFRKAPEPPRSWIASPFKKPSPCRARCSRCRKT